MYLHCIQACSSWILRITSQRKLLPWNQDHDGVSRSCCVWDYRESIHSKHWSAMGKETCSWWEKNGNIQMCLFDGSWDRQSIGWVMDFKATFPSLLLHESIPPFHYALQFSKSHDERKDHEASGWKRRTQINISFCRHQNLNLIHNLPHVDSLQHMTLIPRDSRESKQNIQDISMCSVYFCFIKIETHRR